MSIDGRRTNISRRRFLQQNGMGIGSLALAYLLNAEQAKASPRNLPKEPDGFDMAAKAPMKPPRATAMISLFQHGGPSHIDLTDPKPELTKRDGTELIADIDFSFANRASKKLMRSPWKFAPRGESGIEISELMPHLAEIIDDVCLIRSMQTGASGHEPSIRYFQGGVPGAINRPTFGSWLTYGLGSESKELPAYLVLTDPGGLPVLNVENWSNGFLPPLFQGTVIRPQEPRIFNLDAPPLLKGEVQDRNLAYLKHLNQKHLEEHQGEADLEARIASYELAAAMQTAAREALDISTESRATQALYGLDDPVTREYGTRCLIARRLVERGVRFVQLFRGNQPWDHHEKILTELPALCRSTDRPSAALVKDLKARGLLETTIVHWGGEIGRLPVVQNHDDPKFIGRDHNGEGFSIWLAGGGFKQGVVYGATDEFGYRAVENIVTPNDLQATLLHQFGIDHDKLTFLRGGREERLIDGRPARVVKEILVA